jgi:elongation factor P
MPASVDIAVTEAAEGVRGDSANNVQKPVTLATGKVIQAPLFVKVGDVVRVDTRTGKYLGRA